jgi:hypothetical protein
MIREKLLVILLVLLLFLSGCVQPPEEMPEDEAEAEGTVEEAGEQPLDLNAEPINGATEEPQPPIPLETGAVSVKVLDPIGGAISEVTVNLYSNGTLVDTAITVAGAAEFTDVTIGEYTAKASKPGYISIEEAEFSLASDETINIVLILEKSDEPGNASITILNETGAPLADAKVELYAIGVIRATEYTSSSGVADFIGLRASAYYAIASLDGYVASEKTKIVLIAGQTTPLTVVLEDASKGDLSVKVFQKFERPLPGAEVSLYENGSLVADSETDITGIADFNDLDVGVYFVQASRNGYVTSEQYKVTVDAVGVNYTALVLEEALEE